jgi:hypothetical protein
LRGTFATFFGASESLIAIAYFLLFTRPPFLPLPDRNVLRRRIAPSFLTNSSAKP